MKKILLVPLDERPCCFEFQEQMAKDTDIRIIKPPRSLLPDKKKFADPEKLFAWMEENADGCDGAIVAIDALVYSGMLPSRIHDFPLSLLKKRVLRLRKFKLEHPALPIFAYNLVMRNPRYSSSEQEPDYYEQWGREIHRFGFIGHKKELGIASEAECAECDGIVSRLPQEYLADYLSRREKNIEIDKLSVDLTAEGVIDFLIVPQDDSSPYGFTAKDQQIIRRHIREKKVQLRAYMYPDSDGVQGTLLARMANMLAQKRPLVYVKYASAAGDTVVPRYEDRMVSETVKYQILAAGGLIASSVSEADLIVMINPPSGNPLEHLTTEPLPARIEYDANRNQIEQVEYAAYAIDTLKKPVCFADVAYANGGDPELYALLREKGLLWKIAGYSGWNTSSNTMGIAIPCAMLYLLYGDRQGHTDFLAARYVEDVGYMTAVRRDVCQNELPKRGLNYFTVDGEHGEVAKIIRQKLQEFADASISDDTHRVVVDEVWMPWTRIFNNGIHVHIEPSMGKATE